MEFVFEVGQMVFSKAGRDKGNAMIVCGVLNSNYVYVTDGEKAPINNPKKKNIKHLQKTNKLSAEIREKYKLGKKTTDVEVRNEIQSLLAEFDA